MKEKILNFILIVVGIACLFMLVLFLVSLSKMLNDYRCSQLTINEYYQDEECYRRK